MVDLIKIRATDPHGLYAEHECSVTPVSLTTIIVAPSGGNFTTIQAAINAASAGTVIEVWANAYPSGINGSRTYAEGLTISSKSGTSAQPITLRARSGDVITVRKPTIGTLLSITNSNYWVFDGQTAEGLCFGNTGDWTYTNPKGYPHDRTMEIFGTSQYLWFKKCRFSGGKNYGNIDLYRTAHHIAFDNCVFEKHLNTKRTAAAVEAAGDGITHSALRVLFRDCDFKYFGGHNMLLMRGAYSVLRGGKFWGYWPTVIPDGSTGYRHAILNAGDKSDWDDKNFMPWLFGPILAEGVYWDRAGFYDDRESGNHKCATSGLILRGNLYADSDQCWLAGVWRGDNDGYLYNQTPFFYNIRVYNNTAYKVWGTTMWSIGGTSGYNPAAQHPLAFSNHHIKNNIVQQTGDIPTRGFANRWLLDTTASGTFASPTQLRDCIFSDNVFTGVSEGGWKIRVSGSVIGTFEASLASIETNYPARAYGNDIGVTVTWANTSEAPGSRTFSALTPTTGSGYQDAEPLTTVTANSTGMALTVGDATWFYDGANATTWNLGYFGEANDYIAIGTDINNVSIRQIASISRDATTGQVSSNTIQLTAAVNATVGMKVWFAGNPKSRTSNTVWKNRGAGQIAQEYTGVNVSTLNNAFVGAFLFNADDPNWNPLADQTNSEGSTIVSSPVRSPNSNRAVKVFVNRDLTTNSLGQGTNERSETRWANPANFPKVTATVNGLSNVVVGARDYWIGFSVYVPSTWKRIFTETPSGEETFPIIFQCHHEPCRENSAADNEKNPWITLNIASLSGSVTWYLTAMRNRTHPVLNPNTYQYSSVRPVLKFDEWTDWVLKIRQHPETGRFEAWRKDSTTAGAFVKTYDTQGRPAYNNGVLNGDGLNGIGVGYAHTVSEWNAVTSKWVDGQVGYTKFGTYVPLWDNVPWVKTVDSDGNEIKTTTIYQAQFRVYDGTLANDDLGIEYVKPR